MSIFPVFVLFSFKAYLTHSSWLPLLARPRAVVEIKGVTRMETT